MSATSLAQNERIDYAELLPQRTKMLILASVLLSLFLAALDQTIVATALPAIVADFQGLALVSWVSTGYLLASTAMVPIYGKLSDLYGRKLILLWGIVVFLLGSALCGVAGSMVQLIVYRVIQGIGAAALTSTAFAIPADLFTPAERPRYMGLFGSIFGLASVIGPFLGGFLTDQLSWRWVFYVNLPVGLVALGFVWLKMPALASGLRARIDWLGTIFLILAVAPLMLGLTIDKTLYPWNSALTLGLFATAAVGLILFLMTEARAPSPILDFALFRNRTYTVGMIASVLNGAAFFGAIFFLSLFMVNVLGMTATQAGTAQIPLMVAFVASSNLFSQIVQRVGRYKIFVLGGFVVMLLGFVLLTQINVQTTMWGVTWRMFILGLGMGPALPLLNLAVQNAVPYQQIGSATASRQFFQQLGQAVGGAIFGVVLTSTLAAQLVVNVAPIAAQLPPPLQGQLELEHFQLQVSTAEHSGGEATDITDQLVAAAHAPFAQERAWVTAALEHQDETARAALLSDPLAPTELKSLLAEPTAEPSLAEALGLVDQAEHQLVQEAQSVGAQVTAALKQSFATSITTIYSYALWLVAIALLLIAFCLPELPLRKTNRQEAPAPAFE
jgi:EmrB/QacA subfamily drug resistance transporter